MIKKATKNDIDAVAECYRELLEYEEKNGSNSNWVKNLYPTRSVAEEAEGEGTLYVVEEEGKICGSVILNHFQPEGYKKMEWGIEAEGDEVLVIHTLCIPPSMAGKGYGRKIMGFALDMAKELGCRTIRLDTYTGNVPAASLYKKLGYRLVGETSFMLHGIIEEELKIFELILSDK